jgi:hypothetical protein
MRVVVRVWGLAAAAVAAAGLCSTATGGEPQRGILDPVGGGVQIVYTVGASSVRCSYGGSSGLPRLACGTRPVDGDSPKQVFAAVMDPHQVVFLRVHAGRQSILAALPQRAGSPVYGPFRERRTDRIIQLLEGATVGFLGTNIACTAEPYGNGPAIRCLAHGPGGLPGPCCGPNYPLLVRSTGFFLTPRRLQALGVVSTGVREVPSGTVAGPLPPPFRVIRNWLP